MIESQPSISSIASGEVLRKRKEESLDSLKRRFLRTPEAFATTFFIIIRS